MYGTFYSRKSISFGRNHTPKFFRDLQEVLVDDDLRGRVNGKYNYEATVIIGPVRSFAV